jgi:hypothetical protein
MRTERQVAIGASDSETKSQFMREPEKPVMDALDRRGDDSPASIGIPLKFLDTLHDLLLIR